jgi:hypothetical protein
MGKVRHEMEDNKKKQLQQKEEYEEERGGEVGDKTEKTEYRTVIFMPSHKL